MEHLSFYIALSFILTHEIDAVRCKEWQIFPGLSLLDDNKGYTVFTLVHIPLFSLLFWGLQTQTPNHSLIWGLDLFFIIHVGLHVLFLKHPKTNLRLFCLGLLLLVLGYLVVWICFLGNVLFCYPLSIFMIFYLKTKFNYLNINTL
jgi:hypothetical protein